MLLARAAPHQVKAHAQKLASAGFRVLIPDIYKGAIGVDKEEASHLMGAMDWQAAIGEICEAARYLRSPQEGSPAVGCTGFCMGGALALCGAAHCADIACAVPFYGIPKAQLCDLSTLAKPVQGHYGATDPMKARAAAKAGLRARVLARALTLRRRCGCPRARRFAQGFSDAESARAMEATLKAAGSDAEARARFVACARACAPHGPPA
jgi:dienelactone hydrolase